MQACIMARLHPAQLAGASLESPMRSFWIPVLLLATLCIGSAALVGCGDAQTNSADAAECSCEADKAADAGWCAKCEVGYVKGEKKECKGCVDAAQGGAACADCAAKEPGAKETGAKETGAKGAEGSAGECGPDCKCCSKGECSGKDCKCCAKRAADAGAGDADACLCKQGKAGEPVWCEKCDKGYVDGEEAHCKGCVAKAQKQAAK